jgi:hypothetical protein
LKTANRTNALQHLSAVTGTLENDEVRRWKKQGGRVMGYLCSTIPEEMSIQPSWSAGSAAATERSRGERSGFPLPRIREDRPHLDEDKFRGNDPPEADLRRTGCLVVDSPQDEGCPPVSLTA